MTDYDLWSYIRTSGQLKYSWWYDGVVLFAIVFAGGIYLLIWLSLLWRKDKLTSMFFWLVLAIIPCLLVFPSFYVNIALGNALAFAGLSRPASAQAISRAVLIGISTYLNQLATMGIIGMSLSVVIILASLLRRMYVPQVMQVVRSVSQGITKALQKRLRTNASSQYGIIKVISGKSAGGQFGIFDGATIGRNEVTFTIIDEAVSRCHARFEVHQNATYLVDSGSRNGTYQQRNGKINEIKKDEPAMLQHGDVIYLGHPDEDEAVKLLFEKSGQGVV